MFLNLKIEASAFVTGLICLFPLSVSAQITPDGTTNTNITTNGDRVNINDGDRAGNNLFHSFQDFSVPNGGEAFFNNDADVNNIFSRVTGGNISNIDGLIRANNANLFLVNPAGVIFSGGARLDLGGGSFFGSTADSILFEEGEFSATDLDNPPLLTVNAPIGLNFRENPAPIEVRGSNLRVQSGQSLTLLGGDINFSDATIFAPGTNVNLGGLLASGTIGLDDNLRPNFPENVAKANFSLAEEGRINVAGDNGGSITINAGNVELRESGLVAGIGENSGSSEAQAGDIVIDAENNLTFDDGSFIRNQVNTGGEGKAGDIILNAVNIDLNNDSRILSQVQSEAIGDAGDIRITAGGSLNAAVNTSIIADTSGEGDAGNIVLDVAGDIDLDSNNRILSQVQSEAIGDAGDIRITAGGSLNAVNTFIINDTRGEGNAGSIVLDVAGDLNLDSNNRILSQVQSGAIGDAGDIRITAGGSLNVVNTFIIADSKDLGSSGDITVDVADTIILQGEAPDGATIFPSAIITGLDEGRTNDANRDFVSAGQGEAGDINISARELIVQDLGFISSNTEDLTIGDAGNVNVNVENLRITDNGSISSFTENVTEGSFDAGSINVNARTIELLRGGKFITVTDGDGDAGNINLNVTERLTIDGSGEPSLTSDLVARDEPFAQELQGQTGLFANASDIATGDGGNIKVGVGEITPEGSGFVFNITQPTDDIIIANEGVITADSQGTGSGGQIFLRANDLTLDNQGEIVAITSALQDGNEEIPAGEIILGIDNKINLDNNSLISAQALNNADGGNIDIAAKFIIAQSSDGNGSDIIASAEDGDGGKITISAEEIFGLREREAAANNGTNDIDASSEFGFDGSVSIETPDVSSIEGILELSDSMVEPDNSVSQVCSAEPISNLNSSSFVIKGQGGIPAQPTATLTADNIIIQGELLSPTTRDSSVSSISESQYQPVSTEQGDIYPAQDVIVQKDGTITLTAYPVLAHDSQRSLVAARNCAANK